MHGNNGKRVTRLKSKRFLTIKETADVTGLSMYYLRQGIHAGWVPYVRCGSKIMVNILLLIEKLDEKSCGGEDK